MDRNRDKRSIDIMENLENPRSEGMHKFLQYVTQSPMALEVSDEPLYSTNFYESEKTTELSFFDRQTNHVSQSNNWIIGMLPNPIAFLVEEIRIEGVISNIRYGACTLHIGNKHYLTSPAWTFGLKERGFKLKCPLLIPPLTAFRFMIQWQKAEWVGKGISGLEQQIHPMQVVLFGLKARGR